MGRGGALVESLPFNRRVVGSNPVLATTKGSWAAWVQIPGGYQGYSPSKKLSGGAKCCASPQENDEIASLP